MQRGFTLVEILIVVAVLAVIAVLAVPYLLSTKLSANEGSAVTALRLIHMNQTTFRENDKDGDGVPNFATSLQQLADAHLIDTVLAAGTKAGYVFTLTVSGNPEFSWECRANPLSPGKSGEKYYYVDQGGVLHYATDGPADSTDAPVGN